MEKLVFVLTVCFGSLLFGIAIRGFGSLLQIVEVSRLLKVSKFLMIMLVILSSVPIVNIFWKMEAFAGKLLYLPFLGLLFIFVGGASSLFLVRLFSIAPERAASVFISGMLTNLGSIGSLICFILFGDTGYLLIMLLILFEPFAQYVLGFPISRQIYLQTFDHFRFDFAFLKKSPISLMSVTCIFAGVLLNVTNVPHPIMIDRVSTVIMPLNAAIGGLAIGLTLQFSSILTYKKELGLVLISKYFITPAIILPIGILLGMHNFLDGVAFQTLLTMSFMPIAFVGTLAPRLYGFDQDLANIAWFISMVLSILVFFPILYFAF